MKIDNKKILILTSLLVVLAVSGYFMYGGQNNNKNNTMDGLNIEIVNEGTGDAINNGEIAVVDYTGTLQDGTKFDSSIDRGVPFSFTLGAGQVIQGWDLGIVGMKVGEVRNLTISPDLGYGSRAVGPIPPNSTLLFNVKLLEIK